jgi:hypothetical protein
MKNIYYKNVYNIALSLDLRKYWERGQDKKGFVQNDLQKLFICE